MSVPTEKRLHNFQDESPLSKIYRINPNSCLLRRNDVPTTGNKQTIAVVNLKIDNIFFHLYSKVGIESKKVLISFEIDDNKEEAMIKVQ